MIDVKDDNLGGLLGGTGIPYRRCKATVNGLPVIEVPWSSWMTGRPWWSAEGVPPISHIHSCGTVLTRDDKGGGKP